MLLAKPDKLSFIAICLTPQICRACGRALVEEFPPGYFYCPWCKREQERRGEDRYGVPNYYPKESHVFVWPMAKGNDDAG